LEDGDTARAKKGMVSKRKINALETDDEGPDKARKDRKQKRNSEKKSGEKKNF